MISDYIVVEEMKKYLSPQMRYTYESAERLDFLIKYSRLVVSRGLIPPQKERSEIISIVEKLMNDVLFMVKTRKKDKKDIKDFEDRMRDFSGKIEEYKKNILRASLGGDPKIIGEQMTVYLEAYATFLYSFILPVFKMLAVNLSLGSSEAWKGIENEFVNCAFNRMGLTYKEEEAKFGKKGEEES